MKIEVRKISNLAVLMMGIVAASSVGANINVTGERTGSSPAPLQNLPHDLSQIAYASSRTASVVDFPGWSKQSVGEVVIPGALPANPWSMFSDRLNIECTPFFYSQCRPELAVRGGAVGSSLKYSMGTDVSLNSFLNAEREAKKILETEVDGGLVDGDVQLNSAQSTKRARLGRLEIFAGEAR